jgi:hypothetical protein
MKTEQGAASIIVSIEDGKLKVNHGQSTWAVLHERTADAGIWDAIWDVIREYKGEEERRVSTNFVGKIEEVNWFAVEWSALLDAEVTYKQGNGTDVWFCEAYATQSQIDELNMESDWIIER